MSPGFVGSFLGFLVVKPICYLGKNVTGGIPTACIMMRLFKTDFVSVFGGL